MNYTKHIYMVCVKAAAGILAFNLEKHKAALS